MVNPLRVFMLSSLIAITTSCAPSNEHEKHQQFDTVIINGTVFSGNPDDNGQTLDIGIKDERIVFIGDLGNTSYKTEKTIDASGHIVSPGFIDPHTHALGDLQNTDTSINVNYLTQGVTTVFVGNDGGGPVDTEAVMADVKAKSPGTNVAFFIGHGKVRSHVVGDDARAPSTDELKRMRELVHASMEAGAVGLSSGLFYDPGSFSETAEVIALAEEIAPYGGVYDTHLRDESAYNIGLIASVEEAIEIGRQSGAKVHLAHIKALGTVVWGQSADIIKIVEAAHSEGLKVTADQYPWRASGTRISNALVPIWAKDGGNDAMIARLADPTLADRLKQDMEEALKIRGGPDALLVVDSPLEDIKGKTLREIAEERKLTFVDAAKEIIIAGNARVASFNMNDDDIRAFMAQPWVMTSSDGTNGHPRKYASFPRKYTQYIKDNQNHAPVMDLGRFIHQSSGLTAETFSLCDRGYIREGYIADITIFDPDRYADKADFYNATLLSEGVTDLLVNGVQMIEAGRLTGNRSGQVLKRDNCNFKKP
ncbi:amidohydrolase family protein [Kordiimonas sp. SCSIO 12610]|uniref:N-acyl-D-amino-acid deacylase family protein n=1 Tax=Kordiimonas sp. SCSIO 12610 TaxID=2829597 RepID=UPI002109AAC7|nr:amidohydrolase family protein [Kordiimonas sp. SCSIO 12610]UTW54727.1 amidohydrolase family protein [Kordiimonas sp. SCSIO 12610]